jgi:PAS domain S-box-containing protein
MKWLPFEGKFRIFLVLLVLLMVLLVFFQTQVLRRAQLALEAEASRRMQLVTREVAEAVRGLRPHPAGPPLAAAEADAVRRLSRDRQLLAVDLVDADGRVVWSTLSSRIGRPEPESGGVAAPGAMDPAAAAGPVYSRRVTHIPHGTYRWRLEHPSAGLDQARHRLRTLAWIQGGAILVALVSVLLFARWTLYPYRKLLHTVKQAVGRDADRGNQIDLPEFLQESFRGVLRKLESQQRELRELRSGNPFRAGMLERMAGGFILLRGDGTVAEMNRAAETLLGTDRAGVVGRPYGDGLPAAARLHDILRRTLVDHDTFSREVVPLRRPDGSLAHLGVSASPALDRDGRPRGAIGLLTDLTEIRAVEERVRTRETLATVGEWSAGMAHEFRNSLGTILGLTRLLMRRLPETQRETADSILDEVGGASRNVEQFLQFARPAQLRLETIDPKDLLRRLARQVETEFAGRIEVRIDGEFPGIQADPDLLRQAFHNLFRNAVESDPERPGRVDVEVSGARLRNRLRIEITDNGAGISTADLPHIFTPFYTTKAGGTGLGLPLVRKVFLSHDGDIHVDSRPGSGTRFVVELPVSPSAAAPPPPGPIADLGSAGDTL